MDRIEGHNFMACGQTYGPDVGSEGDGQSIVGSGLQ